MNFFSKDNIKMKEQQKEGRAVSIVPEHQPQKKDILSIMDREVSQENRNIRSSVLYLMSFLYQI